LQIADCRLAAIPKRRDDYQQVVHNGRGDEEQTDRKGYIVHKEIRATPAITRRVPAQRSLPTFSFKK